MRESCTSGSGRGRRAIDASTRPYQSDCVVQLIPSTADLIVARKARRRRSKPPLIMAADTIAGYIQGLLDGIEFKQTAYALDRDSRKAALARFLKRASAGEPEEREEERRLAA